jgi:hypothetical protein
MESLKITLRDENFIYEVIGDKSLKIIEYVGNEIENLDFIPNYEMKIKNKYYVEKLNSNHFNSTFYVTAIGKEVFMGHTKLKEVFIPPRIKSISYLAFKGCDNLKIVRGGDDLEEIGEFAFYGCKRLTNIELKDKLKRIRSHAFGECYSLKSIIIPASVESISSDSFLWCSNLKIFLDLNKDSRNWEKYWNRCSINHGVEEDNYISVYWKNEWNLDYNKNPRINKK